MTDEFQAPLSLVRLEILLVTINSKAGLTLGMKPGAFGAHESKPILTLELSPIDKQTVP